MLSIKIASLMATAALAMTVALFMYAAFSARLTAPRAPLVPTALILQIVQLRKPSSALPIAHR
jgi:hypothetical protein